MLLELLRSTDFVESAGFIHNIETPDKADTDISNNTSKIRLSDKYRGVLTREKGKKLNEHIQQMRDEWN